MIRNLLSRLFFSLLLLLHLNAEKTLHPSIPVIDMQLLESSDTKGRFIQEFTDALHHIGFCAIINTGFDMETLDQGYTHCKSFFKSPKEQKMELFAPHLNGQRGVFFSENAQGNRQVDLKEFLHIGRTKNLWPKWMDLKTPLEKLIVHLDQHSEKLQEALSIFMGQQPDFLANMTSNGACLLRALYYPKTLHPTQFWAAEHTDIDLFTILPKATEKGLQVLYQGEWIDVRVPKNAFIINCGDMLENMSNGYFKSSVHRVVSQPGKERFSIVYFIHPKDEDRLDPLPLCIHMTGKTRRFPNANRLEMLSHRLVEIGLASDELKAFDAQSGYMERIQELVNLGVASEPVKKTYQVWQQMQTKNH